ncbi:hypothetical protein MED01_002322 [Micromonospora sp. MED01]|uniref:hypothetical protein n=1 Tax=Micromonospora alfalfae TaxID=2911212 RepID=UPI001EE8BA93|nr:hypothetical protein [Micromonospora alfalfae]MCG5464157.1 hypothetical protein [Micromonospora alfalfae]
MRWLRCLRAWFTTQANLTARVVSLSEQVEWAARRKRRDDARHELELEMARADVAELRREAESLNAANESLIAEIQRERAWSNTVIHRNTAAHQFADRLPPDLAADLRGCLSPAFTAKPEEAAHVR